MGRFLVGVLALLILIAIAAFALDFVSLDQTRTAQLPKIEVKGGQLPAFDANVADVEVGTRTVEVPDVKIDKPAR